MSIEFYTGRTLDFGEAKVFCTETKHSRLIRCEQCYFFEKELCKDLLCDNERMIDKGGRSDKKNVYFKEVKDE